MPTVPARAGKKEEQGPRPPADGELLALVRAPRVHARRSALPPRLGGDKLRLPRHAPCGRKRRGSRACRPRRHRPPRFPGGRIRGDRGHDDGGGPGRAHGGAPRVEGVVLDPQGREVPRQPAPHRRLLSRRKKCRALRGHRLHGWLDHGGLRRRGRGRRDRRARLRALRPGRHGPGGLRSPRRPLLEPARLSRPRDRASRPATPLRRDGGTR